MELIDAYVYQMPSAKELKKNREEAERKKMKNDYWITKEGQKLLPMQMNDHHLLATIRLIEKNALPMRKVGLYVIRDKTPDDPEEKVTYLAIKDRMPIYILLLREAIKRRLISVLEEVRKSDDHLQSRSITKASGTVSPQYKSRAYLYGRPSSREARYNGYDLGRR